MIVVCLKNTSLNNRKKKKKEKKRKKTHILTGCTNSIEVKNNIISINLNILTTVVYIF